MPSDINCSQALLLLVCSLCSGQRQENKSIIENFGNFKFPSFNLFNAEFWKKALNGSSEGKTTTPSAKLFDKFKGWVANKIRGVVSIAPIVGSAVSHIDDKIMKRMFPTPSGNTIKTTDALTTTMPAKSTEESATHGAASITRLTKDTTEATTLTSSTAKAYRTKKTSEATTHFTTSTKEELSTAGITNVTQSETTLPITLTTHRTRRTKEVTTATPISSSHSTRSTAEATVPVLSSSTVTSISSTTATHRTKGVTTVVSESSNATEEIITKRPTVVAHPATIPTVDSMNHSTKSTTTVAITTSTVGKVKTTDHSESKSEVDAAVPRNSTLETLFSTLRNPSDTFSSDKNLSEVKVRGHSDLSKDVGLFATELNDKQVRPHHSHKPLTFEPGKPTYIVYQEKELQSYVMPEYKEPSFHTRLEIKVHHKSSASHPGNAFTRAQITSSPLNGTFTPKFTSSPQVIEQEPHPYPQHPFEHKHPHLHGATEQKTPNPLNHSTSEQRNHSHGTYKERISHSNSTPEKPTHHPWFQLKTRDSVDSHEQNYSHSYSAPEQKSPHPHEPSEQKHSHVYNTSVTHGEAPHSFDTYERQILHMDTTFEKSRLNVPHTVDQKRPHSNGPHEVHFSHDTPEKGALHPSETSESKKSHPNSLQAHETSEAKTSHSHNSSANGKRTPHSHGTPEHTTVFDLYEFE